MALLLVSCRAALAAAPVRSETAADKFQCGAAIAVAEKANRLPPELLWSIAIVESGRQFPTGMVPWPWSINVEGESAYFDSKAQAVAAVQRYQAAGRRSIDVGCMQINLLHHPAAFTTLDQAFDPIANATYGAHFLKALYDTTHSWPRTIAAYHSSTPGMSVDYSRKVMATWSGGVPLPPPMAAGQKLHPGICRGTDRARFSRDTAQLIAAAGHASRSEPRLPVKDGPCQLHVGVPAIAVNSDAGTIGAADHNRAASPTNEPLLIRRGQTAEGVCPLRYGRCLYADHVPTHGVATALLSRVSCSITPMLAC